MMYSSHQHSDFSLIYQLLCHYHVWRQHTHQPEKPLSQQLVPLYEKLESFIASERYTRLPSTASAYNLSALHILYAAATLLQQLQHHDIPTVLEQNRALLLHIADLRLESDPLHGAFYPFVVYCATQAHDDALALRYSQRHEQYQHLAYGDTLWRGLEEWGYDSSLSNLLSEPPPSESPPSELPAPNALKATQLSTSPNTPPPPTVFMPPTQQSFHYHPISNTHTHRITLSILYLNQGCENRFQATLARRISLIPQRNRLELHLNLEPEKQAIPLLRHIEDALWKLRLIFDTGTIDIATTAIHQQETSLNRLRVGFEMPLAWAHFLSTIDIDALWHALSTIVLMVVSVENSEADAAHTAPAPSTEKREGRRHA